MPDSDIPSPVRRHLEALTETRPMRRGSLSERYMTCSKPTCVCSTDPQGRHGPYFSLTRGVQGSTRSRMVTAEQAKVVRAQIEAGQQFRKQVEAYWQACEQWADSQLGAAEAVSAAEAAKKGGSKRRSTPKSSAKSKR